MADDPFEIEPGTPFDVDEDTDENGVHADSYDDAPSGLPPAGVAFGGDIGAESWPHVDEDTVRSLLEAQGSAVHALVAVDKSSDEWVWLRAELDAIVPPLTRIINRYEPLARLTGEYGDPIAVAIAIGGYGRRSLEERAIAAANRQLAAHEEAAAAGEARFRFTPAEGA